MFYPAALDGGCLFCPLSCETEKMKHQHLTGRFIIRLCNVKYKHKQ